VIIDKSTHDENGQLREGPFRQNFTDGKLFVEGQHLAGQRSGVWKVYLRSGQLKATGPYLDHKMHGEWTWFSKDGALVQVGSFDNDELQTGKWMRYHANGQIKEIDQFEQGKKVAKRLLFDENGKELTK
jgi:antitoxin component YwqK of YwqJK toxin-antitoxin module